MKKKVMALALILPLVFMITLFSIGRVAGVYADIPVSGIRITSQHDNGFINVDLATYADDLFITAQVEPVNAKNKKYYYSVGGVGEAQVADVSVGEDGLLHAQGTGSAKITVTSADNSFTDSVIVNVYSSKVTAVKPRLYNALGENVQLDYSEGSYGTRIKGGVYSFASTVFPSSLSDATVLWSSSDADVLEIDAVSGKANAKLSGDAVVTAECSQGAHGAVRAQIKVNVSKTQTASGISVNGMENPSILCSETSRSIILLLEKNVPSDFPVSVGGLYPGEEYVLTPLDAAHTRFSLTLSLSETSLKERQIEIRSGGAEPNVVKLRFEAFSFEIYNSYHNTSDDEMYHKNGSETAYTAYGETGDADVNYVWSSARPDVLFVDFSGDGKICRIKGLKQGKTELNVKAYRNGVLLTDRIKSVEVVNPVASVEFSANAQTHGIENLLALADTEIRNNKYYDYYPELGLCIRSEGGRVAFNPNDFVFECSDAAVAEPYVTLDSLKLRIKSEGKTLVSVKWKYADYFNSGVSASVKVRCVKGGVRVDGYDELVKATEDGKKVVLDGDVMLGKKNATEAELRAMAKTMPTDYDWQYYANKGLARPEIYYLIEFKNDLYGNGFSINADYITKAVDSTGIPLLFKGPLDFVSVATASVKAQDNAVFLVRTKGVIIDNVSLKGCSESSLVNEGGFDLSELNYTGTTLEIAADCRLVNSRVSNGRTTVRVFGGKTGANGHPVVNSAGEVDAEKERIKVSIESCILTNAREFILKIGSNRAVRSTGNSEATFSASKFPKRDGGFYETGTDALNDEYFYRNYVLTDLTLENSVLSNSGLFSVGMETHFAGIMLAGVGGSAQIGNWRDLAATSFPSVLRLKGDVRLLDWKNFSQVDSSTLIETTANAQAFLKLDISEMINKVYKSQHNEYKDIISEYGGNKYVHGGIALYGGGLNYSGVYTDGMTSESYAKYKINISVLAEGYEVQPDIDFDDPDYLLYMQGTMLPLAAGTADFNFYMYNSKSVNNYQKQLQSVNDGTAFAITAATV